MPKHFDPMASLILSAWSYPYPVPKGELSRKDKSRIRKAATRERTRLLRLSPGETTEMLGFYRDQCHQGQAEVYAKQADYLKAWTERLARAQVVCNDEAPTLLEAPTGHAPAGGLARQQYFASLRLAAESGAAARRHLDDVRAAQVEIDRCAADRTLIDYYASLAVSKWKEFHSSLWNLHMYFAVGENIENPTLRLVSFASLQPPEPLRRLSLEAPEQPARALEVEASREEAEPASDGAATEEPLSADDDPPSESAHQER